MNLSWFKNPDNVVYADADTFIKDFGEEAGIDNLKGRLEDFYKNPTKEGLQLIGKKRTSMLKMTLNQPMLLIRIRLS